MIVISAEATRMIDQLEAFYIERNRDEAVLSMTAALARAYDRIEAGPLAVSVFAAPRPYPGLSALDWKWIVEGSYWVAYVPRPPDHVVTAVFHARGDGPGLVARNR